MISKIKHTKKECQSMIEEKKLPLKIVRIAQLDRLLYTDTDKHGESIPVFSWNRLFDLLTNL